jgi:hypothetical protein
MAQLLITTSIVPLSTGRFSISPNLNSTLRCPLSLAIFLTYYTYTQVPIQPGYWG